MPHPSDIDEPLCSDDQLLLLDLLYGELPDDAATGARKTIDDNTSLREEFEGFEALRGFMRELPDEEPSTAITAKLLHAAANAAPATSPSAVAAVAEAGVAGGGFFAWLKRFFQPMMMHPGLAAAASLVLVVGIAGAMYLGGKSKMAEPTASRTSNSAPASEMESTGESPKRDESKAVEGLVGKNRFGSDTTARTPSDQPAGAAPQAQAAAATDKAKRSKKIGAPSKDSATVGGKRAGAKGWKLNPGIGSSPSGGADTAPGAPETTSTPRPKPVVKSKPRSRASSTRTTKATQPPPPPSINQRNAGPPPPAAPPATKRPTRKPSKKPTTARGTSGSTITADPEQPTLKTEDDASSPAKTSVAAARLHKDAKSAAKEGDCKRVRVLASRIRSIDSRYYDTKFLGDRSLDTCLRPKGPIRNALE